MPFWGTDSERSHIRPTLRPLLGLVKQVVFVCTPSCPDGRGGGFSKMLPKNAWFLIGLPHTKFLFGAVEIPNGAPAFWETVWTCKVYKERAAAIGEIPGGKLLFRLNGRKNSWVDPNECKCVKGGPPKWRVSFLVSFTSTQKRYPQKKARTHKFAN